MSAKDLPADLVKAIRRDLKISPEEYLRRAAEAQRLASYAHSFRRAHANQFAGAWIGPDGRPTIAVTNNAAAKIVASDGYQSRLAAVSEDGLDAALEQLGQWLQGLPPQVGNTIGAIGIDLLNNQLIMTVANTPFGQALSVPTLIARVKVVLSPGAGGPIVRRPMGGDTYLSAPASLNIPNQVITVCSFGFAATDGQGNPLNISAGHCDPNLGKQNQGAPVYVPNVRNLAASPQAGNFTRASLGGPHGLDYSLIRLNDRAVRAGMDRPWVRGGNGTTIAVTGAAEPVVGAPICKAGQTSAFTCGLVTGDKVQTALQTDDGRSMTVRGFSSSVCTLSGDSGGPVISGTLAMGITSGSNSSSAPDCNAANLGLALDGGTASLGIPINRILSDIGGGVRIRTLPQP
ncbi:MAG: protease [Mycobacteriaceae bacterium]|nr:protease [Mycobacteriaceae bacterium]